jgi:hypothetical protein
MASRVSIVILSLFILYGCSTKESVVTPDSDIDKDDIYQDALLWVFKPNVNIRESASGSSKKVSSLVDGDSVLVLNNVNGWYQIKTIDGQAGWIRSDLLGPKELSAFKAAVMFIENLKEYENTELYFDKKLYHKRIYISYPQELYSSRQEIEKKTREVVKKYQKQVYRGKVTARILKPGTEEEYLTLEFKGALNADPLLPIIPFGRIEGVYRDDPSGIKLTYSVPENVSDEILISTARDIVPRFPISYQQVEITFKDTPYTEKGPCRLWYMEDKNGENYRLGKCY